MLLLAMSTILIASSSMWGVLLDACLVVVFTIFASLEVFDIHILVLLSFLPALSLVTISLDNFFSLITSYLLLLFISIMYAINKRALHFPRTIKYAPFAVILGLQMGFVFSLLFKGNGSSSIYSLLGLLFGFIIAISEGIYFQMLFQHAVNKFTSPVFGVIATAVLFTLFHFTLTIPLLIAWEVVGLLTAILYQLTKNIYFTILFSVTMQILYFSLTGNMLSFIK